MDFSNKLANFISIAWWPLYKRYRQLMDAAEYDSDNRMSSEVAAAERAATDGKESASSPRDRSSSTAAASGDTTGAGADCDRLYRYSSDNRQQPSANSSMLPHHQQQQHRHQRYVSVS